MTDHHRTLPRIALLGLCATIAANSAASATIVANAGPSLPVRGATSSQGSGVDLSDAIRAYARMMRLPAVFIDPGVPHRTVRYSASNLDAQAIFDELLRANGLSSIEIDGVLHVAPSQTIALRYSGNMQRLVVRRGSPSAIVPALRAITDDRVAFFPDDVSHALYAFGPPDEIAVAKKIAEAEGTATTTAIVDIQSGILAQQLIEQLQLADTSGTMRPLAERNAIAVTGDQTYIDATTKAIQQIDHDPSSVYFTVSIVEIVPKLETVQRGLTLGPLVIGQAGAGASGSTNSSLGTAYTPILASGAISISQWSASLAALQSTGEARILKRVTVYTTHQKSAKTDFGRDVPIVLNNQVTGASEVRTVDASVGLEITPTIGTSAVTTDMKVKYSEIIGNASNGYPILSKRNDEETITLHDGETMMVAGLYEDESLVTRSSNPPFSYIPIVGSIFKHRDESAEHGEIVIVATPHIVTHDNRQPGFDFPIIPTPYLNNGIRATPKDGETAEPFPYATPTPKPSSTPKPSYIILKPGESIFIPKATPTPTPAATPDPITPTVTQ